LIDETAKTSVENLAPDDLKGYAKFIADFADSAPKIARKCSTSCWGCLTESLLSSMPNYGFRNGCLHAIGQVFLDIRDDPKERDIRENIFNTVLERSVADKNALTRSISL
jgi:hypothetical protein